MINSCPCLKPLIANFKICTNFFFEFLPGMLSHVLKLYSRTLILLQNYFTQILLKDLKIKISNLENFGVDLIFGSCFAQSAYLGAVRYGKIFLLSLVQKWVLIKLKKYSLSFFFKDTFYSYAKQMYIVGLFNNVVAYRKFFYSYIY